jgi:hypothetical protein
MAAFCASCCRLTLDLIILVTFGIDSYIYCYEFITRHLFTYLKLETSHIESASGHLIFSQGYGTDEKFSYGQHLAVGKGQVLQSAIPDSGQYINFFRPLKYIIRF